MRFVSDRFDQQWQENYELACVYYQHYGNLDIACNFKTKDGITYDEEGISLGRWIHFQRHFYKKGKLSEERTTLLENIGMRFASDRLDQQWQENYELACIYYQHYGNLNVVIKFKTKDGINYNKEGISLGRWVSSQRQFYKKGKLSRERQILLEDIGIIWNIRRNKDDIIELCDEYGIDYRKSKSILTKSYNEVYVKLCYLQDNNMPIIIDNNLNEIFNMSDINMQVSYGVSLNELIDKYMNNKSKIRIK